MLAFVVAFGLQPPELLAKNKAFYAPLLSVKQQTPVHGDCPAGTTAGFVLDFAAYLDSVARQPALVRMVTALGLAQTKTLLVCFERKRVTVLFDSTRQWFNVAKLDLAGLADDHYWLLRVSMHDWWHTLNTLDRAQTGLRVSRLDALLVAASAIVDADAEALLARPLTGNVAIGELGDGSHFAELEASDTSGHARFARAMDLRAPHREFGRKKRANEWGFFGGVEGFSGEGAFFVQLEPSQVRVADSVRALDRKRSYMAPSSTQAGLVATFDTQRLRRLFERVGRPEDTKTFLRQHGLGVFVDIKRAPNPAALLVGDRVDLVVTQSNDRIRATFTVR